VQDIADWRGDSLDLARRAAQTEADVIVFCGVRFMAETAKILSPQKTVLMPDLEAGCGLAEMITVEDLRKLKAEHPKAAVVCYINTNADVKAECDLCCTSSSAVAIVNSVEKGREIIFVPDKSLGRFVEEQTGRAMILWNGYCPPHHRLLAEAIRKRKSEHPAAPVVVHPECTEDVRHLADKVAGTGGMLKFCRENPATEFIIGTEPGMAYRLEKEIPGKKFYPVMPLVICRNMKKTTLEKVLWSLEDMKYEITVEPDIARRARKCIDRMLDVTAAAQTR
jgi:quinolinate synthase